MHFAAAKKKENIAEYVLYMFQVEDLIRANRFDIEALQYTYINSIVEDDATREKFVAWYRDIAEKMEKEEVKVKGHIQDITDIIIEVFYLHNSLLNIEQDKVYEKMYHTALPFMKEFQQRADNSVFNDIETAFNALYGKLILKLQKKEITPATEEAMQAFSKLLAYLAAKYKQMKTGNAPVNYN
jgi:hypothetical protein